jgi:hypothetical protein
MTSANTNKKQSSNEIGIVLIGVFRAYPSIPWSCFSFGPKVLPGAGAFLD